MSELQDKLVYLVFLILLGKMSKICITSGDRTRLFYDQTGFRLFQGFHVQDSHDLTTVLCSYATAVQIRIISYVLHIISSTPYGKI